MAPNVLPADIRLFGLNGFVVSLGFFFAFIISYYLYSLIYNVFFHPLRHIPGPLFARACSIPYVIHMRTGTIVRWVREQHEKYGDAVRLAPSEVSFISGETAWQDIYGYRTAKQKTTGTYMKDRSWYAAPVNKVYSLLTATDDDHSRMRRNLSHAFSDKALREQEVFIHTYVDLLVRRLEQNAQQGKAVDITRWYNYTTFDIIADLAFGESLHCLRDGDYHQWVLMVFSSVKSVALTAIKNKYAWLGYYDKAKSYFQDTKALERAHAAFYRVAAEKVDARLAKGIVETRPDFFNFIIKNQESETKKLTRPEMASNSVVFLAAGSETTATALSGTTYLLLKNPDAYAKVVHEIRTKFTTQAEITVEEVNKLQYMVAVLQEGLRYYPPVATGFPRVVPAGGDYISGHYISEGTAVYVSHHAANHSTRNFKDPDKFVPERWLGAERYKDDNRDVVNPFSFGPRNCLGKSLAYAEMRLIFAKVLFNFDLELVDPNFDWLKDQKLYTLWEKPVMMLKLTPVQR